MMRVSTRLDFTTSLGHAAPGSVDRVFSTARELERQAVVTTSRLALVGFGTVGRGLVEILLEKRQLLEDGYDYRPRVVAVTDLFHGSCYDPAGLDLQTLLDIVAEGGSLNDYPGVQTEWDSLETIRGSGADVVVEVTVTNLETGEPRLQPVHMW